MEVYRVALETYIRDLSGLGARMCGGRWNLKGTSIIYTSESGALAGLEYLVHVPMPLVPSNLKVAVIHVPDDTGLEEVFVSDLPDDWKNYPAPKSLAILGTGWIKSNKSLLLKVPSAVTLNEYNILINPAHEDMKWIKVKSVEDFKIETKNTIT